MAKQNVIHIYPVTPERMGASRIERDGTVVDLCGWGADVHPLMFQKLRSPAVVYKTIEEFIAHVTHIQLLRASEPDGQRREEGPVKREPKRKVS